MRSVCNLCGVSSDLSPFTKNVESLIEECDNEFCDKCVERAFVEVQPVFWVATLFGIRRSTREDLSSVYEGCDWNFSYRFEAPHTCERPYQEFITRVVSTLFLPGPDFQTMMDNGVKKSKLKCEARFLEAVRNLRLQYPLLTLGCTGTEIRASDPAQKKVIEENRFDC